MHFLSLHILLFLTSCLLCHYVHNEIHITILVINILSFASSK
nr:MAG TPA: hypothetical protein [Bacteriophage sp.]